MLRRRITLATLALMGMVLLAAGAGLVAQSSNSARLGDMIATDRNITAALELSLTVRDVYAHQAHSIILNDRSHLGHYGHSVQDARNLLIALEGFLTRADAVEFEAVLASLRRDVDVIDETFSREVVPKIGGTRDALMAPHETVLAAIERITRNVDALALRLRERLEDARVRAEGTATATRLALIALALLAIAVAGLIVWRTARTLGPRLASLAEGAQRYAAGDLAHRIAVPPRGPPDELSTLASQMNAMAEDLGRHQAQLVEAQTLASVGRLAAGVAHEVNNPLAAILGFARFVERVPEARADAQRIVREAERCRDIVKGLLELSRPATLDLEVCDVAAIGDLVAGINESFAAAGMGEARVVVSGEGRAQADLPKLRQVLWNLMKNAHEAGGEVTVEIVGGREGIAVAVRDEGPGFTAGVDPSTLFEPFYSSKAEGSGLGLAVSRAIVQRHGADLVARSGPGGRGASFEFRLPAAQAGRGVP
jgi:signal transduction histidine kinase